MLEKIKYIFSFKWMSKVFFVRCFLLNILIAVNYGLYVMIKSGKIDYDFIKALWISAGTILGAYTVRKVIDKKGE